MSHSARDLRIEGMLGRCGSREVFLGFAPARFLHSISFADVLNEETGRGYQRRFNDKHSLDFRKYIQEEGSTTIPLTFNLRPRCDGAWKLIRHRPGRATLRLRCGVANLLSQVDCQHRLGHLSDLETPLAFMTFIGLRPKDEMKIFNVINGKAKGLCTSLLDFHELKLVEDIGRVRPELVLAMRLNDDEQSPWYKQLDLGGNRTSGMTRRASLRTMQKAIKRFLKATQIRKHRPLDDAYQVIRAFWNAITIVLEREWANPRKHFLTKGIGVYSLMNMAGDLYLEAHQRGERCTQAHFASVLSDFVGQFDWSTKGPLQGLGGEGGANHALGLLRKLRSRTKLKVVKRGA